MLILGLLLPLLNMGMDMYEKEWPMEGPNGWRLERVVCNLRLGRVKEVWYQDKKAAKKEEEEEQMKQRIKEAKQKAAKEAAKKVRKIRDVKKGQKKSKKGAAKKGQKISKKRELLQTVAAKKIAKQESDTEAAKEAKNHCSTPMA